MQSKIRIAAVVLALTGLAWTGYWVGAKVWLRGAIADWAAAREAEGFTVGIIEQDITGFPFALEVHFPAPTLGRLDDPEPWVWMPDRLDITLRPWAFDRARIVLPAELEDVAGALRRLGLGDDVDRFELKMNRAAEAATGEARDVLWGAVAALTLADVFDILNGGAGDDLLNVFTM